MDDATESYIMLLLADGNLPTGSFVASSGLESFVKHGFFQSASSVPDSSLKSTSASSSKTTNQNVVNFIHDNLSSYARSALPFVSDSHDVVADFKFRMAAHDHAIPHDLAEAASARLRSLDDLYHAMTLNDVARRASKSQGVALLTLFSKGFSKPQLTTNAVVTSTEDVEDGMVHKFVEAYKATIRREEMHGHLPICWGILTAALGLSVERSRYLHLFLQARSLLSASIRLNTIGPYAAQQILLHSVKPIVEDQMASSKTVHSGLQVSSIDGEDGEISNDEDCAASTWPLGEILAARHDLQHSRIFNS